MSNLTSVAYLVSSVLFILSLRGLSHPTTAKITVENGVATGATITSGGDGLFDEVV